MIWLNKIIAWNIWLLRFNLHNACIWTSVLQNHIFSGLAIFDKHHQADLIAILDVFFGWGGMWMELYQVTNKRNVYNLEALADKVSYEEKIPLTDLCAIH